MDGSRSYPSEHVAKIVTHFRFTQLVGPDQCAAGTESRPGILLREKQHSPDPVMVMCRGPAPNP